MFYRYLYLQTGGIPIGRWYKETTGRVAEMLLPDNLMSVFIQADIRRLPLFRMMASMRSWMQAQLLPFLAQTCSK